MRKVFRVVTAISFAVFFAVFWWVVAALGNPPYPRNVATD